MAWAAELSNGSVIHLTTQVVLAAYFPSAISFVPRHE